MIWEESKKSRAKTGFSQEHKNFVSKELVNLSRFVLSKERWIHYKRAQRSTSISCFMITQKKTKIHHKQSTRRTKLRCSQNPGGHKEGRASFPIQSQYKDSKIHSSNPTLEEKGRKNRREGERRMGGRGRRRRAGRGRVLFQALRERGGEGVFMVPTQGSKIPLDLNLRLKRP